MQTNQQYSALFRMSILTLKKLNYSLMLQLIAASN